MCYTLKSTHTCTQIIHCLLSFSAVFPGVRGKHSAPPYSAVPTSLTVRALGVWYNYCTFLFCYSRLLVFPNEMGTQHIEKSQATSSSALPSTPTLAHHMPALCIQGRICPPPKPCKMRCYWKSAARLPSWFQRVTKFKHISKDEKPVAQPASNLPLEVMWESSISGVTVW